MIYNDVFKEQLVKVEKNSKTTMKKTVVIGVATAVGILAMVLGGAFIGPVIILGLIWGASYLVKSLNLEYEYILVNHELDIDKIMNKERRKKFFTVDIQDIHVVAHIDDEQFKAQLDNAEVMINVGSGIKKENTYVALFRRKDKLTKMIFEPNEDMQRMIFKQAPSKVHLKK